MTDIKLLKSTLDKYLDILRKQGKLKKNNNAIRVTAHQYRELMQDWNRRNPHQSFDGKYRGIRLEIYNP